MGGDFMPFDLVRIEKNKRWKLKNRNITKLIFINTAALPLKTKNEKFMKIKPPAIFKRNTSLSLKQIFKKNTDSETSQEESIRIMQGHAAHEIASATTYPQCPTFSLYHSQAIGYAEGQDLHKKTRKGWMTTAIKNIKELNIPCGGGVTGAGNFINHYAWVVRGDFWWLTFRLPEELHSEFLELHKYNIISALKTARPNSIEIHSKPTTLSFELLFE